MGYDLKMRVWRGDAKGGDLGDYTVEVEEGEVVLDMEEAIGVGFADLDLERIDEVRQRIPALSHRRPIPEVSAR